MKIPDKVTDEQLEIIKATEGYIRVASVPGSGKMMDEMDKKKLDTSYIELMTSEDTTQIDARLETENNAVERGRLLSVLSGRFGNLFVVGDDDQNIYSWRGSNPEYMIHFHEDYPEVKSYQLTENFRSTPQVVELAKALIIQNKNRLKKDMFTRNLSGAKPVFDQLKTEKEESAWIANCIGREMEQGKKYSDLVVLVRASSQTRSLEEAFVRRKVPYKILSGAQFYETECCAGSDDTYRERVGV